MLGGNTLILTNASGDFEGDISGTGGLEIAAGTETLSGNNDYSGATTIDSGATLIVTGSLNVASTIINNGTFTTSGAVSTGVLNGSGNLGIGTSLTLTGPGTGNYSGILSGAGNLFVGNGTHNVDQTFTNAETYTGTTTIASDGILRLATSGTDGSISASSLVTDNGVFDISGLTNGGTSIVSLAGSGSVTLGANTLTLTAAADTFSGIIGGTGGLTVAGGTETLSGANTYSGATTISSGATLDLTGAGSIAVERGGRCGHAGYFRHDQRRVDQIAVRCGRGNARLQDTDAHQCGGHLFRQYRRHGRAHHLGWQRNAFGQQRLYGHDLDQQWRHAATGRRHQRQWQRRRQYHRQWRAEIRLYRQRRLWRRDLRQRQPHAGRGYDRADRRQHLFAAAPPSRRARCNWAMAERRARSPAMCPTAARSSSTVPTR